MKSAAPVLALLVVVSCTDAATSNHSSEAEVTTPPFLQECETYDDCDEGIRGIVDALPALPPYKSTRCSDPMTLSDGESSVVTIDGVRVTGDAGTGQEAPYCACITESGAC